MAEAGTGQEGHLKARRGGEPQGDPGGVSEAYVDGRDDVGALGIRLPEAIGEGWDCPGEDPQGTKCILRARSDCLVAMGSGSHSGLGMAERGV